MQAGGGISEPVVRGDGSLEARGFELGRGAFGGWGDGEPGLVRAVWCLTRHGVKREMLGRHPVRVEPLPGGGDALHTTVGETPERASDLITQTDPSGRCRRRL